ncbi:hypothetical protein DPMN_081208 [Dreissena polymorpha]|uniref:Uncharacterized protein n=1 Tax=Dreissena polymorpha TaxID=45954 RepID=A0A9D3Y4I6_DREPO|nr:hypothetical protein DPMN_081208 [Dreissena polymorpha]
MFHEKKTATSNCGRFHEDWAINAINVASRVVIRKEKLRPKTSLQTENNPPCWGEDIARQAAEGGHMTSVRGNPQSQVHRTEHTAPGDLLPVHLNEIEVKSKQSDRAAIAKLLSP